MVMSSMTAAYDILVVAPFPYQSHWIFMERIIRQLIERGHSITTISPFKYRNDDYENENLKEYLIPKYKIDDLCKLSIIYSIYFSGLSLILIFRTS